MNNIMSAYLVRRSFKSSCRALAIGVSVLLVLWFYIWTVASNGESFEIGSERHDYYNLLLDGLMQGQLNLAVEVPQALLDLEDPYDPQQNQGIGLHDVSYYRGKYYLYWGVTPIMVLFMPFRLLFGVDLPLVYGVIFFCAIGYTAAVTLWLRLQRRYFPEVGLAVQLGGVFALGLAAYTLALLRRPNIWELPIAAGYCFAMLALLFLAESLFSRKRLVGWLGASLALGLAVGARPTYIVAAPMLIGPFVWEWWRKRRVTGRGGLVARDVWPLIGVASVFGSIIAGLCWYNYARFGSPLEFGMRYQLTGAYEAKLTHFSLNYVPFNLYVYYLAPAQWGRYFPFINVISPPEMPEGYYGYEFVYGVLTNLPLVWLALALPLTVWRRDQATREQLGVMLTGPLIVYTMVAGLMLFFVTAAGRYMADFVPSLMLLGCIGLLAVERWSMIVLGRLGRVAVRTVTLGLMAFSIFFAVMTSFQLHELLRQLNPHTYDRIAYAFNHIPYWVERLCGAKHGPLEITVRFPQERVGHIEPVLTTGRSYVSDHLFVHYLEPDQIRFGFDHTSRGVLFSRAVKIDFASEHRLILDLGSLYPPAASPFYKGVSPFEVAARTRWLRVALNGEVLMDGPADFYDASPESISIGENREVGYSRFTGAISNVRRLPFQMKPVPGGVHGTVSYRMVLPRGIVGRSQPLLAVGNAGRADILYLSYLGDDRVQFGYDHWGVAGYLSEPVVLPAGVPVDLRIRMGALFPPKPNFEQEALRSTLLVQVDGRLIWAKTVPFHQVPEAEIAFGRNDIGASTCDVAFTGTIYAVERELEGAGPSPERWRGSVECQLLFPRDRIGRSEPLLISGEAGRADILFVRYVDDRHVRLGLDHWGASVALGDLIAVDYAQPVKMRIELKSLQKPDDAAERVRVVLNGEVALEREVEVYRVTEEAQIVFGENRIGASSCDPAFTGGVITLTRVP